MEVMCVMHQADPYGHLIINGSALEVPQLSRMVGCSEKEGRRWMLELEKAGVFSKTLAGVIFSRRMVKDEKLRGVRAEAGKLGGNPDLVGTKVNQNAPPKDNQKPTPSSSVFGLQSSEATPGVDPPSAEPPGNTAAGAMAAELRRKGVSVTSQHPTLLQWLADGFSIPSALEAVEVARLTKPVPEPLPANYVDRILRNPPKKAEPAWWSSDQRIIAKGKELDLNPRPGEEMVTFKERIQNEIGKRKQAA